MSEQVSYQDWMTGDAVLVGHRIMVALPPAEQVARAIAVLDQCRSRWQPIAPIDRVATVGRDPTRWHEGHDVFDDVRSLTLLEERLRTSDVYRALLYVGEIAAKIIYNASGSPAPFDADSPWWLASNARAFATSLNDAQVSRAIWVALAGSGRSHGR